jgi:hypothetical protein
MVESARDEDGSPVGERWSVLVELEEVRSVRGSIRILV